MKFCYNKSLRELMAIYDVPVSSEIPEVVLNEPVGMGKDLSQWVLPIMNGSIRSSTFFADEIDNEIRMFLMSPKLIERSRTIAEVLISRHDFLIGDYYMVLYYESDGNLNLRVDMELDCI